MSKSKLFLEMNQYLYLEKAHDTQLAVLKEILLHNIVIFPAVMIVKINLSFDRIGKRWPDLFFSTKARVGQTGQHILIK